jgi:hypothetical protein
MKNLEKGQMIHFNLVNVGTHIGKHIILARKLELEVLVLLEQRV